MHQFLRTASLFPTFFILFFCYAFLQKEIDLIFQAQSNSLPLDADREREGAYQRAIEVDARLTGLQHSLTTLVGDLNMATERSMISGKENGGVGQIVQLLNSHHETLVWLENTTKSLERDLAVIGRTGDASGARRQ